MKAPAPPPEVEEVQELRELIADPVVLRRAMQLLDEYESYRMDEKEACARKEKLGSQLKDILGKNGVSRARCGDYRLAYFSVTRKTLDRTALLNDLGPIKLAKYEKETTSFQLKISVPGAGKEE